jgi:hypothetical protein
MIYFLILYKIGVMYTLFTLNDFDGNKLFQGVMATDSNNNITYVYDITDPDMKNLLYPTSSGIDTSFTTPGYPDKKPYDVYQSIHGTTYDNIYVSGADNFDGAGLMLTNLGSVFLNHISQNYHPQDILIVNISGVMNNSTGLPDNSEYTAVIDNISQNLPQEPFIDGIISFQPYYPPNLSCLAKNTEILLSDETTIPIQSITPGTLVQTLSQTPKRVSIVGKKTVHFHNENENKEDYLYYYKYNKLCITGKHSLLVKDISNEDKYEIEKMFGCVKKIDGRYALPVYLDPNASLVNNLETCELYHIVLENDDISGSYGICANGRWVESCSENDFYTYSGMMMINNDI